MTTSRGRLGPFAIYSCRPSFSTFVADSRISVASNSFFRDPGRSRWLAPDPRHCPSDCRRRGAGAVDDEAGPREGIQPRPAPDATRARLARGRTDDRSRGATRGLARRHWLDSRRAGWQLFPGVACATRSTSMSLSYSTCWTNELRRATWSSGCASAPVVRRTVERLRLPIRFARRRGCCRRS